MREIKFRAWDKVVSKMHVDVEYGIEYCDSIRGFAFLLDRPKKFDLMQYTGLKDKNGKEIYEGDILEWTEDRNIKCEVKYNAPSFEYFWNDAKITLDRGCYADYSDIEVIGNIHENKELLK